MTNEKRDWREILKEHLDRPSPAVEQWKNSKAATVVPKIVELSPERVAEFTQTIGRLKTHADSSDSI